MTPVARVPADKTAADGETAICGVYCRLNNVLKGAFFLFCIFKLYTRLYLYYLYIYTRVHTPAVLLSLSVGN